MKTTITKQDLKKVIFNDSDSQEVIATQLYLIELERLLKLNFSLDFAASQASKNSQRMFESIFK